MALTDREAPGTIDDDGALAPEDEMDEMVEDELLVEEVSIDGMCGVY